jgi:hypothetical protein
MPFWSTGAANRKWECKFGSLKVEELGNKKYFRRDAFIASTDGDLGFLIISQSNNAAKKDFLSKDA